MAARDPAVPWRVRCHPEVPAWNSLRSVVSPRPQAATDKRSGVRVPSWATFRAQRRWCVGEELEVFMLDREKASINVEPRNER